MEGFPSIEELRTWADQLEEVQERLAPYFERAEPRQRVMAYLRGLLSITERKNGWQLAELAGEAKRPPMGCHVCSTRPTGMRIKCATTCNSLS
jgi:hypothetical protein